MRQAAGDHLYGDTRRYHCWIADAEGSPSIRRLGPSPAMARAGQAERTGHKVGKASAHAANTADAVWPLGPTRSTQRCSPAKKQANHQQGYRSATLAGNIPLADEKSGDQKEALIAAAHRERGRARPSQGSRVRSRWSDVAHSETSIPMRSAV